MDFKKVKQQVYIFRLIAALVLCTITCDLGYSAFNAKLQKDPVFLCESESGESSEEVVPQSVPQFEIPIILLSHVPESDRTVQVLEPSGKADFSPHGWTVPIFIDHCVYRL